MIFDLLPYLVFAVALPIFLISVSVKVIREYERAVVFLLGRFQRVKGPGLMVLVPSVQQMERVDLRTRVLDVPSQDVISRDNVSVQVHRGGLLPRPRPAARGDPGRALRGGDEPAR
jgi:regulator of protease activity HflC (stomatin/prohibitin superfamily)